MNPCCVLCAGQAPCAATAWMSQRRLASPRDTWHSQMCQGRSRSRKMSKSCTELGSCSLERSFSHPKLFGFWTLSSLKEWRNYLETWTVTNDKYIIKPSQTLCISIKRFVRFGFTVHSSRNARSVSFEYLQPSTYPGILSWQRLQWNTWNPARSAILKGRVPRKKKNIACDLHCLTPTPFPAYALCHLHMPTCINLHIQCTYYLYTSGERDGFWYDWITDPNIPSKRWWEICILTSVFRLIQSSFDFSTSDLRLFIAILWTNAAGFSMVP